MKDQKRKICVWSKLLLFILKNNLPKVFKLHGDSFLKVLMIHLQGMSSHIFDQLRNTKIKTFLSLFDYNSNGKFDERRCT